MKNTPSAERLNKIPRLYSTEGVLLTDKIVYLHFSIGESHWYIMEYDGNDLFFGFAVLNGDYEMAEFGYVSFSELKSICVGGWLEVCCDSEEEFPEQPLCEIQRICQCIRM